MKEELESLGYQFPRQLPNGDWIALNRFVFTWGLVIGIDDIGYKRRYCYGSLNDALKAVANWNGEGDPPGNWIVEKPSQRQGPGSTAKFQRPTPEQEKAAEDMAALSRELDLE